MAQNNDYTYSSGTGARSTTEKIGATGQKMADDALEAADRYREQAQETALNMRDYVEKSVRTQPMMTLAVASAVGFVLGALWKR